MSQNDTTTEDDCADCPTCKLREQIEDLLREKYPRGDTNVPLLAMAQVQAWLLSGHPRNEQDDGVHNINLQISHSLEFYRENPSYGLSPKAMN